MSATKLQDLLVCSREGDLKKMERILDSDRSLADEITSDGMCPLQAAILGDNPDAVRLLLRSGANPNRSNAAGNSPLHIASFHGLVNVARALLSDPNTNINELNAKKKNALHLSCKYGHFRLVRLLLSAGCDFNALDREGKRPADYTTNKVIHQMVQKVAANGRGALNSSGGGSSTRGLGQAIRSHSTNDAVLGSLPADLTGRTSMLHIPPGTIAANNLNRSGSNASNGRRSANSGSLLRSSGGGGSRSVKSGSAPATAGVTADTDELALPSVSTTARLQLYEFDAERNEWAAVVGSSWRTNSLHTEWTPEDGFVIATQNVWFAQFAQRERFRALLSDLEVRNADAIAIQEATSTFLAMARASRFIRRRYYMSDVCGETVQDEGYGVAFLLRRGLPWRTTVLWSDLPSRQGRKIIVAECDLSQWYDDDMSVVAIANAHLESNAGQIQVRRSQIRDIVLPLLNRYRHAIFVGDFNLCATSEENEQLMHLTDSWSTLRGDEPGWTEDTDVNVMRLKVTGRPKFVRFDRVLIRSMPGKQQRELRPTFVDLLSYRPICGRVDVWPSDHFGLIAKVAIVDNAKDSSAKKSSKSSRKESENDSTFSD